MPAQPLDRLILHRCYQLWDATKDFGDPEITTAWAAETLVRMDGGPRLSAVQLGPALRALGYRPMLRRQGARRVRTWLLPGKPPAPRGRPRKGERRGAPDTWPGR
jgi:hypothetical protein